MVHVSEQLITDRLVARRLSEEDVPTIFKTYASDERVARYMTWPVATEVAHVQAFVSGAVASWPAGTAYEFAVVEQASGEIVGGCGMHQYEKGNDSHYVFGYCFAARVWGQGYATEIARALVAWFDGCDDVVRFAAWVDLENPASARVLEKAGLEREGILRRWIVHPNLGPTPRDVFMYARVK
jgi:ribosomal-protein-alanine N-acetyltransferase